MAQQGKIKGVRQKKQGGGSKSNKGRNESPSRIRYRLHFFDFPLSRKARKILAKKGGDRLT